MTAANITYATNFTLIAGTNASEPSAYYVGMEDYSVEFDYMPNFLVEFNTTVSLTDFSIRGTSKDRYNTTALTFEFDVLGADPSEFICQWSSAAISDANQEIVRITLQYGDTAI